MKIEIRSDSELTISGYVNAVERWSELLPRSKGRDAPGDFRECVKEGAFADSLSRLPAVKLMLDHNRAIGENGRNLVLTEDNIGLRAELTVDDEETVTAARAGRLKGWSFGMENAFGAYCVAKDGTYERKISKLDLLEVSLLTKRPAYHATSIELRDGAEVEMRTADDLPEVSAEELEQINQFTRGRMKAEDVYVFPVRLCDNEIDRDGERFSLGALSKLAELYVGKTGIFDHDAKSGNQTARIFHAEAIIDSSKRTSYGELYAELIAKAYMIRTAANADLIKEIEGGIKKEVSVGCCVAKNTCSVCGANRHENPCGHIKGKIYDGVICCGILEEPTDAYEWSFVAVPAQPSAGVTKTYTESDALDKIKAMIATRQREIEILKLKGKM